MNVIFLDIDGVLNAWESHPNLAKLTGHVKHRMRGWPMWLRPTDGARLQSFGADIVWATTWIEHGDALEEVAEAVGLPFGLPRIHRMDYSNNLSCGKLVGVETYLTKNDAHAVAWIDDDLMAHDYSFIRARRRDGKPTLGIQPSQSRGLQEKDFQALDKLFRNE